METCPYDQPISIEEVVINNFDHSINQNLAEQLKLNEAYGDYAAYNFHGRIWWCRKEERWKVRIMRYLAHVETIVANTLEELMVECCEKYGNE